MMKKAFIKKTDYDFYRIPLPLSVIRRKRRHAFVFSELEKRHPKFSASFATDTHYTLHHFKPAAEITVMDGSVLAEYHRRFPGRTLLLEGKKDYSVFISHMTRKKAVIALILAVTGACMGLAVLKKAGGSSFPFLWRKSTEVLSGTCEGAEGEGNAGKAGAVAPTGTGRSDGTAGTAGEDFVFSDPAQLSQRITESLLENIKSTSGEVKSFDWENDRLTVSVSGSSPEQITSAFVSAVSYEKNTPFFTVSLNAPRVNRPMGVKARNCTEEERVFLSKDFIPLLRRQIFAAGGEIKSEQVISGGASVSFAVSEKSLSKILWQCSNQASLASLAGFAVWESSLLVQKKNGGINAFYVSASWQVCPPSLTETERENSVMNAVSKYTSVFASEGKEPAQKTVPVRTESRKNEVLSSQFHKIGEITDGKKQLIYFKSKLDGKIIVEQKEVVNE